MLMAKLMQQLCRFSNEPFEVVYLAMNPGFSSDNLKLLEQNAQIFGLPLKIFETNIFEVISKTDRSPHYLCAKMRRGFLYSEAQKRGCNKIALGHHMDDVIETALMSVFYGGRFQAMPPVLDSQNFPGMRLIRPMYAVSEADILAFKNYHGLKFLSCACKLENCGITKRQEAKALIAELNNKNPSVSKNIFNALHNVRQATLPSYDTE